MLSARDWALTLLVRSQKNDLFPDRMLWELYEKHPDIPSIDRAFIQQLLFGVFRWRSRIDWVLEQCAHAPLKKLSFQTLSILRLGAFQLLFLDKVPPSAAVNESVKLAKSGPTPWTGGLINGILRTLSRIQTSGLSRSRRPSGLFDHHPIPPPLAGGLLAEKLGLE